MKNRNKDSFQRILLYTGIFIQSIYIFMTPFYEIPYYILISSALLLIAGFIDLSYAKKELEDEISDEELKWQEKRKNLQDFYSSEENLNKSFSECLKSIQSEDSHNDRIAEILDNYHETNTKFKIKLNRKPENRLDQYLQE